MLIAPACPVVTIACRPAGAETTLRSRRSLTSFWQSSRPVFPSVSSCCWRVRLRRSCRIPASKRPSVRAVHHQCIDCCRHCAISPCSIRATLVRLWTLCRLPLRRLQAGRRPPRRHLQQRPSQAGEGAHRLPTVGPRVSALHCRGPKFLLQARSSLPGALMSHYQLAVAVAI